LIVEPETSSFAILTTKCTKDKKREYKCVLSILRALRGETIYDQINWNFPDYRFVEIMAMGKISGLEHKRDSFIALSKKNLRKSA